MSILTKEDRQDLVYSMRRSLLETVASGVLTESKKAAANDFILNEATYEQLLNLAFNPERETNYKPIEVLEKVAMETYASVLQESVKTEEKTVVEESVFGQVEEVLTEGERMEKAKNKAKEVYESGKGKVSAAWAKIKSMKDVPDAAKNAWKTWRDAAATPDAKKAAKATLLKYAGRSAGAAAAATAVGVGTAKYLKSRREKKAKK